MSSDNQTWMENKDRNKFVNSIIDTSVYFASGMVSKSTSLTGSLKPLNIGAFFLTDLLMRYGWFKKIDYIKTDDWSPEVKQNITIHGVALLTCILADMVTKENLNKSVMDNLIRMLISLPANILVDKTFNEYGKK